MPPPLSRQSHAARMRHIAQLRQQLGTGKKRKSPVPFPDLRVEQRVAPTSDELHHRFSSQRKSSAHHKDAKQFPSSTLFKQGPQLITPGDIETGRVHDYGGHKPNKGSYS